MTLTLELPPDVEGALAEDARHQGTTPEQLVLDDLRQRYVIRREVASQYLPADINQEDPTLALFAQWAAEDPVMGPEDAAARQREGDELMVSLQGSRFTLEGRTDFNALLNDDGEDTPKEKAA